MINAGIPTIFINAEDIGYKGTELQSDINSDPKALAMFESIRAHGAVKMGLISDVAEAANRQHTPKVAFVGKPQIMYRPVVNRLMRPILMFWFAHCPWVSCTMP